MSPAVDVMRRSLPPPDELILEEVEQTKQGMVLFVRIGLPPRCPTCAGTLVSRHSFYTRTLRDLPWQGQPVTIRWQTRRFRCRNGQCSQKIFAEWLPGLADPRARETGRHSQILRFVGYTLGGKPGSRLLHRLGFPASTDTILRRVKQTITPSANKCQVRVLGVDDGCRAALNSEILFPLFATSSQNSIQRFWLSNLRFMPESLK